MTTNATTVGFKLAQIKQEIIELENKYPVITEEDKQKLHELRQLELSLSQNYNINLEDWVINIGYWTNPTIKKPGFKPGFNHEDIGL